MAATTGNGNAEMMVGIFFLGRRRRSGRVGDLTEALLNKHNVSKRMSIFVVTIN